MNIHKGRRKKFSERCVASFPEGTFDAIASVLSATEDRTDFLRQAVSKTIKDRVDAGGEKPLV